MSRLGFSLDPDEVDDVDGGRRVAGSHKSPGRKSTPPRMAARVRGVAVLWSRLQPVMNVETDMMIVNKAKSVANLVRDTRLARSVVGGSS